jgi:hypothetical protein
MSKYDTFHTIFEGTVSEPMSAREADEARFLVDGVMEVTIQSSLHCAVRIDMHAADEKGVDLRTHVAYLSIPGGHAHAVKVGLATFVAATEGVEFG